MIKITRVLLAAMLISGTVILTGCNAQPAAPAVAPAPAPAPAPTQAPAPNPASPSTPAKEVSMTMRSFSFTPSDITVAPGQTVNITLRSSGGTHDFVIDELGINSGHLASGETKIIQITAPADAAGKSYQFYCSLPGHRGFGMVGTLRVVAP